MAENPGHSAKYPRTARSPRSSRQRASSRHGCFARIGSAQFAGLRVSRWTRTGRLIGGARLPVRPGDAASLAVAGGLIASGASRNPDGSNHKSSSLAGTTRTVAPGVKRQLVRAAGVSLRSPRTGAKSPSRYLCRSAIVLAAARAPHSATNAPPTTPIPRADCRLAADQARAASCNRRAPCAPGSVRPTPERATSFSGSPAPKKSSRPCVEGLSARSLRAR